MTRTPRWLKFVVLPLLVVVIGVLTIFWFDHAAERTYYGAHTDVLRIGEHVVTPSSASGVVEEDPAWDEDSCEPDRPIRLRLASGDIVSLPRRTLHR